MVVVQLDLNAFQDMKEKNKRQQLTLYIANRAFGGLQKFSAIYKHSQIVDLAFKNEYDKNKIQRFGLEHT